MQSAGLMIDFGVPTKARELSRIIVLFVWVIVANTALNEILVASCRLSLKHKSRWCNLLYEILRYQINFCNNLRFAIFCIFAIFCDIGIFCDIVFFHLKQ